jgi:hypothetical protein
VSRSFLAACVGLALLLAGCKVETTVDVDVDADGTGRVRAEVALDRDAARQVPDLAKQLRVDDLRAAGWQVDDPRKAAGGGVAVAAVKRFRTPAEAAQAIEELSGPTGPFRDFELQRDRSFLKTKTALTGTVDLRGGVEGFGDDTLRERLGGSALGVDPAELEQRLGTPLAEVFLFDVAVHLPGHDAVEWRPRLGERLEVRARAERWNVRNIGSGAVSLGTAVALVVVLLRRRRSA